MIQFEIKKNLQNPGEFSYDLRSLAQSFFPEKSCRIDEREELSLEEGYPIRCLIDGEEVLSVTLAAGYDKNTVKKAVYEEFSKRCKRTLSWGILTGIRPAKIALRMKMEGIKPEKIREILQEEYLVGNRKAKLAADVADREYELVKELDYERGYSVYIGIPFCPSICQYCSFSSYDYSTYERKVKLYLEALEKEMEAVMERVKGRSLHTIYVGGGTPTSLNEQELQRLMDILRRHLPMEAALEFTVEAGRPDSLTRDKLVILKKAGVTRISINPQTMKQHTLELLGRRHTVGQVKEAFALAREVGFDNINMDLILGLPEEDEVDFYNTLLQVNRMDPDSVTIHTLVIKRASQMRREQMEKNEGIRPEDTLIPILQRESEDMLRSFGYEPYYMYRQKNKAHTTRNTNQENVAYARSGKECLYNVLIMEELETIIAFGSGGSTKYVIPEENRMERIENVKNVEDYINRIDEMIERKEKLWR